MGENCELGKKTFHRETQLKILSKAEVEDEREREGGKGVPADKGTSFAGSSRGRVNNENLTCTP